MERALVGLLRGKPEGEAASKDECAVMGCGSPAVRHFGHGKVEAALESEKIRPTHGSAGLCREHYRAFKKATREDRKLDRTGW